MNVYAITPTGARPEGLALLGEYLDAQTYQGPLTWAVVDDCDPPTRIPRVRKGIMVQDIRPDWRWRHGMNTQAASMAAGLAVIPDTATVLILEDDDVYLPNHIEHVLNVFNRTNLELVGERVSRYYNVTTGRSRVLPGTSHASLATVGCRGEGLAALRRTVAGTKAPIDVTLWRGFAGHKQLLESCNVVGIKGLPGRPGIGVGHRTNFGSPDTDNILKQWIGPYADNYGIFRRIA